MAVVPQTNKPPWDKQAIIKAFKDNDAVVLVQYFKKLMFYLDDVYSEIANGINNTHSEMFSHIIVSADSDDLDVTEKSLVLVDTSAGSVTIGGLKGGVAGQSLDIIKTDASNSMTLEHVEGVGTQDIYTNDASDIAFASRGGAKLRCDGAAWYVVSE